MSDLTKVGSYISRVEQQIKQFDKPEFLQKLPPIYHYYMKEFIRPKIKNVFGVNNSLQIYVGEFKKALLNSKSNCILSIGSGDANVEIAIATKLISVGVDDFTIDCLELSPVRIERARSNAETAGVLSHLNFIAIDLNSWEPDCSYAGIMAHHVLHHIANLEGLFSSILSVMEKKSCFVSIDMIGRNGHMRWPECESMISELWKTLPAKYKFNHQFQKQHNEFINWDCSNKGFEGIREEDILPLLNKYFDYDKFLGYGNLTDIFIERGYGHNFNVESEIDLKFIEGVEALNEFLLSTGYLKPTIMFSVWKKRGSHDVMNKCYANLTPSSSIRETKFSRKIAMP